MQLYMEENSWSKKKIKICWNNNWNLFNAIRTIFPIISILSRIL